MSRRRAYLDWNASAPILSESADAVARALHLGNPSSVHAEGRAARAAIEQARAEVAALVNAEPSQVTFTSGGTESAIMALQPISPDEVLLIGAAEHACVRSGGTFPRARIAEIAVDAEGRLNTIALDLATAQLSLPPGLIHVAVQIANNETGVLHAASSIATLRQRGLTVTCDAIQAAGRIAVDMNEIGADFLLLSAHKIGGPKGVGALVARKDACGGVRTLISGGGQEKGLRGGTENVAGIVGFGVAARIAKARLPEMTRIAALRDRFEADVLKLAPDAVFFGASVPRLPNTSLFAVPGIRAETALIAFDLDGIAVSAGSACSSGKVGRSPVLAAMGVAPALADCALRISLGWTSEEKDLEQCLNSLERQIRRSSSRRQSAA